MRLKLVAIVSSSFALGSAAFAWDTDVAHPRLADAARVHADRDDSFSRLLREELALRKGVFEELAIQRGFDDAVNDDIASIPFSRLEHSHSLFPDLFKSADGLVRVEVNDKCTSSACETDLDGASIAMLLRAGTFAEDNPNPRSQHHFHDPHGDHVSPSSARGLDNSRPYLLGLDVLLAEFGSLVRGGNPLRAFAGIVTAPFDPILHLGQGNFNLEGRSALERALNRDQASDARPRNLFALPDAERYLYFGLTRQNRLERRHYLALHFLAFGHVLHLLQDMTSVAHVRNDFVNDHIRAIPLGNLEAAGKAGGSRAFIELLGVLDSAAFHRSRPVAFLQATGLDVSEYSAELPTVDAANFDVSDFWDREDGPGLAAAPGLAELVHDHFFSAGTLGSLHERPPLPRCDPLPQVASSGSFSVFVNDLPVRSALPRNPASEVAEPPRLDRYLSSPLVPHLARCGFHGFQRPGATLSREGPLSFSVLDESVQRDYLEILFPLAIDYTAKLIEHYFAPRFEVVPVGKSDPADPEAPDRFRLLSRVPHPLRFDASAIEVVYETADPQNGGGSHASARVHCASGSGELILAAAPSWERPGPVGDFVCSMPSALGVAALRRGDFWIVVRGALGERGQVGTPAEFDAGEKEFVTAFRRVLGWQLVVGGFSKFTENATQDAENVGDLFTVGFDLERARAGGEPETIKVNRTALLREQLAASLGSELGRVDFTGPSAEPGGTRLVFGGDVEDDAGYAIFRDPSEYYVLDLLQPTLFARIPHVGNLRPSNNNFASGAHWARDSDQDAVFYTATVGGSDTPSSRFVVRHEVGDGSTVSAGSDDHNVLAAHGGRVLVTRGFELYLADAASGERTHQFNLETMQVEACEPPCRQSSHGGQSGGEFSPDGTKVVFGHQAAAGEEPVLYVADLAPLGAGEPGGISLLSASARTSFEVNISVHVAWSQDGNWIAYDAPERTVKVISAAGGEPFTVRLGGTSGLSWLPTLLLPE